MAFKSVPIQNYRVLCHPCCFHFQIVHIWSHMKQFRICLKMGCILFGEKGVHLIVQNQMFSMPETLTLQCALLT